VRGYTVASRKVRADQGEANLVGGSDAVARHVERGADGILSGSRRGTLMAAIVVLALELAFPSQIKVEARLIGRNQAVDEDVHSVELHIELTM